MVRRTAGMDIDGRGKPLHHAPLGRRPEISPLLGEHRIEIRIVDSAGIHGSIALRFEDGNPYRLRHPE